MRGLDLDLLLAEVSAGMPCGENLEYEPDYQALELDCRPSPAKMVEPGDEDSKQRDWAGISERASGLLGKAKDLRLATIVAQARLNTDGMVGLAAGLALVHGLLQRYWDHAYPLLDADDEMDPTLRINILSGLCDEATFLDVIRTTRLVTSKTFGSVTYRDVAIASGELVPAGDNNGETLSTERIDAIFHDCDEQELTAAAEGVGEALEHVRAIDDFLMEKLGAEQAPSFNDLENLLRRIVILMDTRTRERGLMSSTPETKSAAPVAPKPAVTKQTEVVPPPEAPALSGEVTSREDVARMLEQICAYYSRHEPSSPVPLLLQRAKRLVSKDFMEILQDLSPEAVSQAQVVCGKIEEEATR